MKIVLQTSPYLFLFATQSHPEFKYRPGRPDLAYFGFVKAFLEKRLGKSTPDVPLLGVDYPVVSTKLG